MNLDSDRQSPTSRVTQLETLRIEIRNIHSPYMQLVRLMLCTLEPTDFPPNRGPLFVWPLALAQRQGTKGGKDDIENLRYLQTVHIFSSEPIDPKQAKDARTDEANPGLLITQLWSVSCIRNVFLHSSVRHLERCCSSSIFLGLKTVPICL